MGKVLSLCGAVTLLIAGSLVPSQWATVRAQSVPPVNCSGTPLSTPMQGHYTGPWHSEGDYHFSAFGRDVQLHITIAGTLDVTVTADGRMVGNVHGTVDAPVTHEGQRDVSSGTGTISGTLQGVVASSGSLVLLSHPVIDMKWGTFSPPYYQERFITMPDYQFPVGALDCVSAAGTIAEQGFPVQYIVDDANGQIVQVPGIGAATGTWSLTSDGAPAFSQLSQQVDSFIHDANGVLAGQTITPGVVEARIAGPLRGLEATIRQHPDVARCLLDRLGAWEASIVPVLVQRARAIISSDLPSVRSGEELLRSAHLLNLDCAVPEDAAVSAVTTAAGGLLDRAVMARDWPGAALALRESLLIAGSAGAPAARKQLSADFHLLAASTSDRVARLDLARMAYAVGDDADARAAAPTVAVHRVLGHTAKKHKKKKKKYKPTPSPTPTLTPTPPPKTLQQVLASGSPIIKVTRSGENALSWAPVASASRYVVFVSASDGSQILWSWAGSGTSVSYGDTAIVGMVGSGDDTWTIARPDSFSWSVLAVDSQGHIVGTALRVKS